MEKNENNNVIRVTLIYLFVWILNSTWCFAQVRQVAEVMPQFEGSTDGLKKWITQNMSYPQEALQNKEEGRVVVSFIIMEDGSVTQPKVTKGISQSLDAEALRLVSLMPKWIPASQEGKPCSIEYSLPIRFKLPATQSPQNSVAQIHNGDANKDKWNLLPNHNIDEGEFEIFGKGIAKYQYINGSDGNRIFDGHFEYKSSNGVFVEGDFKNDYQVGVWTYSEGPLGVVKIIFNEGKKTITGEFNSRRSHAGGNVIINASGKFMRADDGHLYGAFIYGDKRMNRMTEFRYSNSWSGLYGSGEYNLDGEEKGIWHYREGKRKPTIITEYDDRGRVLESYYIDSATENKKRWGSNHVRENIKYVMEQYWENISFYFLRSTTGYY